MPQVRNTFGISVRCIRQLRQMLLAGNASIRDIAESVAAVNGPKGPTQSNIMKTDKKHLPETYQTPASNVLRPQVLPTEENCVADWDMRRGWFGRFPERIIAPGVQATFVRRWVRHRRRPSCRGGLHIVIDGCAKTIRRSRAALNGDFIHSDALRRSLSVACFGWHTPGGLWRKGRQESVVYVRPNPYYAPGIM